MSPIQKLAEYFSRFPGIGSRQAKRFVYHILASDKKSVDDFIETIITLKKSVRQCNECYRFFEAEDTICSLCTETGQAEVLMIVEKDSDLETIRKSGIYGGRYFILGGLVPFTEKKNGTIPRSKELLEKVIREAEEKKLREIIFALSANPHGDHTIQFLTTVLAPLIKKYSLKTTSLGRGFSTGTEVEYSDSETIKNALENRK